MSASVASKVRLILQQFLPHQRGKKSRICSGKLFLRDLETDFWNIELVRVARYVKSIASGPSDPDQRMRKRPGILIVTLIMKRRCTDGIAE